MATGTAGRYQTIRPPLIRLPTGFRCPLSPTPHPALPAPVAGMEGAQFSRVKCRASQPGRITLLMNNRSGAHVTEWGVGDDGMLSLQARVHAAQAPASCLDVARSGDLAAVGTSEGDVFVSGGRACAHVGPMPPCLHGEPRPCMR